MPSAAALLQREAADEVLGRATGGCSRLSRLLSQLATHAESVTPPLLLTCRTLNLRSTCCLSAVVSPLSRRMSSCCRSGDCC